MHLFQLHSPKHESKNEINTIHLFTVHKEIFFPERVFFLFRHHLTLDLSVKIHESAIINCQNNQNPGTPESPASRKGR